MKDSSVKKKELIEEIAILKRKITKLEKSEARLKQAEDERRESEDKYSKTLHTSHDSININRLEDGMFISINEGFTKLTGYAEEDVNGKTSLEINIWENKADRDRLVKRLRNEGRVDNFKAYFRKKDGSVIHGAMSASVINLNGVPHFLNVTRDITDLDQAEGALQESETRYQLLFNNSLDAIAVMGGKPPKLLFVNPAFLRMVGYSSEEILKYSPEDIFLLVHPDDREMVKNNLQRRHRQESAPSQYEFRIVTKDRQVRWVEVSNSVFSDREQFFSQTIYRDISDRKKAEDALRISEANYRSVIENIQDVFYRSDTHGNLIMASPSFATLLGYETIDDCLGKSITDTAYCDPEKRTELLRTLQSKGNVTNYEIVLKRKDGTLVTVETNSHFYLDDAGNVAGVEGIFRDITERKRMVESLRESEERFRSVVEKSSVGIAIVDDMFLCIYANQECCEISGYAAQELIGRDFTLLLAEESKLLAAERYQRRQRGEDVPSQYEFTFVRKTGEKRIGEVRSAVYLDSAGKAKSIIQVIDITERRKTEEDKRLLEERLQQADKMEAIGTLAGGIAHDFNNLLMGIQGYASMALRNLDSSHPNYEKLKSIEDQVRSGADLTSQLLGFARGGRYEVRTTNMNEIIEKSSAMFGRTKKEIIIHHKPAKDLWNVEVDRGQMEQVFLNMFVNAWQAMPGGGDIYLETENALLNGEQALFYSVKPGKHIKITITDTGTGMDEKTRERIFEPFFTTKEMGRGTGLGMATVYGIIKGHDGIINVESKPGHGTTFTIYLPASGKQVVQEETSTDEIVMGTETILLIDDEKTVMEVNKELLESMGYTIYVAGSGQEGLDIYTAKKDKIDLIILDMIMPGVSGSDTFDRLREINPEVKVLLSSGYSLTGKAQAIMDRGCNGFLQKPFKLEELANKVREMFN